MDAGQIAALIAAIAFLGLVVFLILCLVKVMDVLTQVSQDLKDLHPAVKAIGQVGQRVSNVDKAIHHFENKLKTGHLFHESWFYHLGSLFTDWLLLHRNKK